MKPILLRKIPLPYPHYCYVLARANIHDHWPTQIFLKEIYLLVHCAYVNCACATSLVPVCTSYFIWSSESKHRLETICCFVYFKMAEVLNTEISEFRWIYLKNCFKFLFYCVNTSYPMDNCLPVGTTSFTKCQKKMSCIYYWQDRSQSVHSPGGASYFLPV